MEEIELDIYYKKSQSTEQPSKLDTTSSKKYIYLRKNISKLEIADENNTSRILYEYDEAKLSKDNYQNYLKELENISIQQQRADIDYIALMSGINLDEV